MQFFTHTPGWTDIILFYLLLCAIALPFIGTLLYCEQRWCPESEEAREERLRDGLTKILSFTESKNTTQKIPTASFIIILFAFTGSETVLRVIGIQPNLSYQTIVFGWIVVLIMFKNYIVTNTQNLLVTRVPLITTL